MAKTAASCRSLGHRLARQTTTAGSRRNIALCLCVTLATFLASRTLAAAAPDGNARSLPPAARILAFGDSLTAGIGGSGTSYPQRLAQLIGRDVVNAGIPGDTSEGGRERLDVALRQVRPDLLILCLGVNDYLRGVPHETLRMNLQAIADGASEAGVPVLILAVPDPKTRRVADWFAAMSRPGKVWVDMHAVADVLGQPTLKADLVHPNSEGYRRIADAVAQHLRDIGAVAGSNR